jgi:CcmD family protein
MSNLGFLALGYGLIWVIIGVYAWFVGQRQRTLRREMEGLRLEVDELAEKGARQG